jgi:hypothetical protein
MIQLYLYLLPVRVQVAPEVVVEPVVVAVAEEPKVAEVEPKVAEEPKKVSKPTPAAPVEVAAVVVEVKVEEPAEPKGPVSWASLFANNKAAPAVGSTAAAPAGPEEVSDGFQPVVTKKVC